MPNFSGGDDIAEDKAAKAKFLAEQHFGVESGMQRIFRLTCHSELEAQRSEPIKLLEVNADTIPSGILPVSFGPSIASGNPYPSVIVEVSPEEFAQIQSQELQLPAGWSLGEEFSNPALVAEQ